MVSDRIHQWDMRNNVMAGCFLLILIAIKMSVLHLPFYWDEAWSYAKAVHEMNTHTITLLPSQVNQQVFRGHPLFFYFITSLFARCFSFTPMAMHVCMLLISVFCCTVFYGLIKQLYNSSVAIIALAFLISQEVFIVQSSFLLPEVMIAFLSFFSVMFSIKKSWGLYLFSSCLLVLTKESGIVAIFAICVHAFVFIFVEREFNLTAFKRLLLLSLPLWFFGLFILLQKLKWGWFLFPDHTGLMDFSTDMIKAKLIAFKDFILFEQNRKWYSILVACSIPFLWLLSRHAFKELVRDRRTYLYLIFVFLYAIFSSVNFYSARYLLSFLPFMALFSAIVFSQVMNSPFRAMIFSMLVAIYFISHFYLQQTIDFGDTSKNYASVVASQKLVFDEFIVTHPEATFGAEFLMGENLQHPEMGYMKKGTLVNASSIEEADYIIATCNEPMEERVKLWSSDSLIQQVYSNQVGPAWCKVYQRRR